MDHPFGGSSSVEEPKSYQRQKKRGLKTRLDNISEKRKRVILDTGTEVERALELERGIGGDYTKGGELARGVFFKEV